MSWPLPQDFNESVQTPGQAFADPSLKDGQAVVGAQGLPLPRSGNFADVYQIRGADGHDWAVKCFARPVVGLDARYRKIGDHLAGTNLPFTVGFHFLPEGVRVRGTWYPVLKMEWVEGLLLNQFVRDNAGRPAALDALSHMWTKLAKRLRKAGIAHCDLQHGNVLLVPGSKSGAFGLKLIDYDGMYTPSLANSPAGELGHANYQHPDRANGRIYSQDLDRFPHLAIATALRGLSVLGPDLWAKYDTGENLLFTEADFQAPGQSRLMAELWRGGDPALTALVGRLALACKKPIPQTPWLDTLVQDGSIKPLSAEEARDAEAVLQDGVPVILPEKSPQPGTRSGVFEAGTRPTRMGTRAAPVPEAAIEPLVNELPAFDVVEDPTPKPKTKTSPAYHRPIAAAPSKSKMPLYIGGGVVTILALAGGIFALTSSKKPAETVKVETPEEKAAPKSAKKTETPATTTVDTENPATPETTVPTPVPEPPAPSPPEADDNDPSHLQPAAIPGLPMKWQTNAGGLWGNAAQVAYDKIGPRVAVACTDRSSIPVYSTFTGTPAGEFTEHQGNVIGVCALADGNIASLAVGEPFALVWNATTLKSLGKLMVEPSHSGLFLVSPHGKFAATEIAGPPRLSIAITDTETGRRVASLDYVPRVLRFASDESRLLTAEDGGRIQSISLSPRGGERTSVNASNSTVGEAKAISADGTKVLYYGGQAKDPKRELCVYESASGKPITTLPLRPKWHCGGCEFSPDGKWLAVTYLDAKNVAGGEAELVLFDTAEGKPAARCQLYPAPPGAAQPRAFFGPTGRTLVALRPSSGMLAFEMPRGSLAMLPPGTTAPLAALPTPIPVPIPSPVPAPIPPPVPTPIPVPVAAGTLAARWTTALDAGPTAVPTFTFDGQTLALSHSNVGKVDAYDARTGAFKSTLLHMPSDPPYAAGMIVKPLRKEAGSFAVYSGVNPPRIWNTAGTVGSYPSPALPPPAPGGPETVFYHVSADERYVFAGRTSPREPDPANPGKFLSLPAPFQVLEPLTQRTILSREWKSGFAHFTANGSRLLVFESTGVPHWLALPGGERESLKVPFAPNSQITYRGLSGDGRVILIYCTLRDEGPGLFAVDTTTGQALRKFDSPLGAISDDGQTVAVSHPMGVPPTSAAIDVLDVASGGKRGQVVVPVDGTLPTFSLSADGRSLAVYRRPGGLSVYDVPRPGEAVAAAPAPAADPPAPAVAPQPPAGGQPLAVPGKPRWAAHFDLSNPSRLALARDGRWLYLGSPTHVYSFDAQSGKPGSVYRPPAGNVSSVFQIEPLANGRVMLTSAFRAPVIWDPQTNQAAPVALPPDAVAGGGTPKYLLSPDERYLAIIQPRRIGVDPANPKRRRLSSGPVMVHEVASGRAIVTQESGGTVRFSSDSSRVLIAPRGEPLKWYVLPSGQAAGELPGPKTEGYTSDVLGVSTGGKLVLYHGTPPGVSTGTYVLDGKSGLVLRKLPGSLGAEMSDDGRVVKTVALQSDGPGRLNETIEVLDVARNASLFRITVPRPNGRTVEFALSGDGKALAWHQGNGDLAVYDIPQRGAGVVIASVPTAPPPLRPPTPDPAPAPVPQPPAVRVPIPDEAALAKASENVRSILKAEYGKKTPADRKALVQKLLNLADQTADDPAARYVMLRDARDFAGDLGDAALAMQGVDTLVRTFEVDPMAQRLHLAEKMLAALTSPAALRGLVDQTLNSSDAAADADDFEHALQLAQVAAKAGRKANSRESTEDADTRVAVIKKLQEASAGVKSSLEKLKTAPDDPEANLAVGKFRCFVQGRWDVGVRNLAKGNDAALKATADAEIAGAGTVDSKVADGWWDYAQAAPDGEKRAAEARARHWYQKSLSRLTGLTKVRAETRAAHVVNGVEYKPGLVLDFLNLPASLKTTKKARLETVVDLTASEFAEPTSARTTTVTARWKGSLIASQAGRYRLVAKTTDSVKVTVDKLVLIDTTKGGKKEATVRLSDKPVTVEIIYSAPNRGVGIHSIQLYWVSPGSSQEVPVPAEAFVHDKKAESALGR